jgi:hypothetical protein
MSDDDRTVSGREWRAVREGETHSAPKTSSNNTPESFIVGVGASGALLAGAAIVFVTLVGLVSFNVWPTAQDASTDANVELSAATPSAPANSTVVPVSAAAGQLAATNVGGSGGTGGGGGNGNGGGKDNGGTNGSGPAPNPPSTTPTPPVTGTGNDGSSESGPVSGTKDPSHEVAPTHPSHPHQSSPTGEKGKDPGDVGGDSTGVAGKPPIVKPPNGLNVTPPIKTPTSPSQDEDDSGSSGDDGPSYGGSSHDDDHGCSHGNGHHH